tara:strand:+ start:366 stop:617 length:252 start_codon:yes stop_codon:yes gene_type:complete
MVPFLHLNLLGKKCLLECIDVPLDGHPFLDWVFDVERHLLLLLEDRRGSLHVDVHYIRKRLLNVWREVYFLLYWSHLVDRVKD